MNVVGDVQDRGAIVAAQSELERVLGFALATADLVGQMAADDYVDKLPELYWSLVLEPGWVQAGIWYIGTDKAEVISIGPAASWETEEELLGAADAARREGRRGDVPDH